VGGVSKWMESAAKLVNATSTIMESTNEVLRRLGLI
jgi:hypothetical protein